MQEESLNLANYQIGLDTELNNNNYYNYLVPLIYTCTIYLPNSFIL